MTVPTGPNDPIGSDDPIDLSDQTVSNVANGSNDLTS